jgi:hypothetical protein
MLNAEINEFKKEAVIRGTIEKYLFRNFYYIACPNCLKKSFAILILAAHLFNVCGYRLFFLYAENHADKDMIAMLDANKFDENDLFQIKVALHAPYIQSTSSFERYDGQIEYNGVQYNYVKRMVHDDTLYLYCIPNTEGTRIMANKNLYASQNTGNTPDKTPGQTILRRINLANEYNLVSRDFNFDIHYILPSHSPVFNNREVLKGYTTEILQPPDLFM